jgi:hypothetical protein
MQRDVVVKGRRFSVGQVLLPEKDQGLGIHHLYYYEATNSQSRGYFCGQNYKWLDFNFFYMTNSDIGLGAPWVADAQFVYLGYQYPLSDEMRKDLLEKIRNA